MSEVRNPLIVHQSDPGCLALVRARADGVDDASEPAKIGTATHAAAEDLTYHCTMGGDFDPMAVVTRAVNRVAEQRDMASASVHEALTIMEKLLRRDDGLRFFDPGDATCYPEWKWALDEDFAPVHPGSPEAAYEGTLDALRVYEDTGKLVIPDYKSILKMPAGWELYDDWQARVYDLAVLAHYPNARQATFRLVLLRHGYWIEETFARGEPWEASTRARMRYDRERRLKAHETGDWPEQLGVDCKWCPLVNKCGTMAQAIEQGKKPKVDASEQARRYVAVKGIVSSLEAGTKSLVQQGGPIPLGDGSVLGAKPVQKWALVHSEAGTLERLRALGMSFDQEGEWFAKGVTAAKAKDALRALLGREFKAFITEGEDPIVEPYTAHQHAVWWPEGKPSQEAK